MGIKDTSDPSHAKQSAHALITSARSGQYVNLKKVRPYDLLSFYKTAGGTVNLFWRYTFQSKTLREPIGVYDSTASPNAYGPTARGFGIVAAMRRAEELSFQHQQALLAHR